MNLTLIHGKTYQAKDEIKRLGGRWNKKKNGWDMPSQKAYDEALKYCESFVIEQEDSDAVEDIPGWKKSVDWMFQERQPNYVVPLKENKDKPVKSGQKISGIKLCDIRTTHDTWIVTCQKREWGNDTFAVVNTQTLSVKFMTSEEIKQYVWLDIDLNLAKSIWQAHLALR